MMNNWTNKIYTGDCLYVLNGLDTNSVDLIYLDPPFNSNRVFSAPIGSKAAGSSFEDMWKWEDVDKLYLEEMITEYPFMVNMIQTIDVMHSKPMKAYITYMAQRIIQMARVLKDDGSFYLHCDPTASHYLKIICDRVFGKNKFRSEITWKRNSSHNDSKSFGNISDKILFYGNNIDTSEVRVPLNEDYVKKFYRYKDKRGVYRADNLSAKGLSGGGYEYDLNGHNGPWRYPKKRMQELIDDDRIHYPKKKDGVPAFKRYLKDNKGQVPSNLWTDISTIQSKSKERTGYPTQKPLALLRRIITASSNEGDMVFDPFCGCATTCVAAQQLGRQWIGIDIESQAADLLIDRLTTDAGLFKDFTHRTDIPKRTDISSIPPSLKIKDQLYIAQQGICNGCQIKFEKRNLEIDHIVPKSKGGGDYVENYQLLCPACNRTKSNKPMEYLLTKMNKLEQLRRHQISF